MTDPGRNAPVWWDKEVDAAGRPIRLDVRTAAHQIWDAARRQAQHLLGDASEAPELMENAVAQVSRYLDRTGAGPFTQNTTGILMCAFCRSLRRYAQKLKRLQLVGGSAEFSEWRTARNGSALVELWLELERLSRNVSDQTRAMVGLRLRGFDWKEIAGVLQITDTAARTAFWREVRRARLKGLGKDPKQRRE
jgi:DNA-directed RNA polymerase specialized sigma24 family protein